MNHFLAFLKAPAQPSTVKGPFVVVTKRTRPKSKAPVSTTRKPPRLSFGHHTYRPVKSTVATPSVQGFCKCHYSLHCHYVAISDLNQIIHYSFPLKCGTKGMYLWALIFHTLNSAIQSIYIFILERASFSLFDF